MARAKKSGLFEPDAKRECEWFFRFEKEEDCQNWYDMFTEDLRYITGEFRKMKIFQQN